MNRRDLAKLQRMIDKAARTAAAAHVANATLMDWCREYYGHEPGDIDADGIIDKLGGCGMAGTMPASEFDEIMSNTT